MTRSIVAATIDYRDIHLTVCRARRSGLACGTCSEFIERAARALAAVQEAA
jgi:hypothetical protein